MDDRILYIEKEIQAIQERNRRVEADKAWETSLFRVLIITIATYVLTSAVLYLIGVENFYLASLIPTVGYFLSVQSLPFVKRWWLKKRAARRKSR